VRLIERDKRTLHLRRNMGSRQDAYGDTFIVWDDPVTVRAACQPTGGAMDAQIYGTRVKNMYTLFYDGLEVIQPGDGLCIHVAPDAHPDYRVTSSQGWDHQRMDAEMIPPEQRKG